MRVFSWSFTDFYNPANARCGNGVKDIEEDCDANDGTCCSSNCTIIQNGAVCRAASVCENAATCTGTTCAHSYKPSSTLCRSAQDDTSGIARYCTGASALCPGEYLLPQPGATTSSSSTAFHSYSSTSESGYIYFNSASEIGYSVLLICIIAVSSILIL